MQGDPSPWRCAHHLHQSQAQAAAGLRVRLRDKDNKWHVLRALIYHRKNGLRSVSPTSTASAEPARRACFIARASMRITKNRRSDGRREVNNVRQILEDEERCRRRSSQGSVAQHPAAHRKWAPIGDCGIRRGLPTRGQRTHTQCTDPQRSAYGHRGQQEEIGGVKHNGEGTSEGHQEKDLQRRRKSGSYTSVSCTYRRHSTTRS